MDTVFRTQLLDYLEGATNPELSAGTRLWWAAQALATLERSEKTLPATRAELEDLRTAMGDAIRELEDVTTANAEAFRRAVAHDFETLQRRDEALARTVTRNARAHNVVLRQRVLRGEIPLRLLEPGARRKLQSAVTWARPRGSR